MKIIQIEKTWRQTFSQFKAPHSHLKIFIVINFLVYLKYSVGTPICFDDCTRYISLMGKSVFVNAYDYVKSLAETSKSWLIPLFFSFFGTYNLSNAMTIVIAQTIILFSSWNLIAYSIASKFRSPFFSWVFIFISLSAYLQQNYFFNHYLLSDSLGLSTILIYFSLIISFSKIKDKFGIRLAILAVVVSALFAVGCRDANITLVLCGLVYIFCTNYSIFERIHAGILFFGIILVITGQLRYTMSRHSENFTHILAGFILPSTERVVDFLEYGMPKQLADIQSLNRIHWCSASVKEIEDNILKAQIPDPYSHQVFKDYVRWALTHPNYFVEQAYNDRECILGQSFANSEYWSVGKEPTLDVVYPKPGERIPAVQQGSIELSPADFIPTEWKLIFSAIISVFLAMSLVKGTVQQNAFGICILLTWGGLGNAVTAYFLDLWEPNEMMRHAYIGSILFNTGFVVSLFSAGEALSQYKLYPKKE